MLLSRAKTFPIVCTLDDGDIAKFVQAKIYDKDGTLIDTVSVPHNVLGIYQVQYAYDGTEQNLIVRCKVFADKAFTTPDTTHSWPSEHVVFSDSATPIHPDYELDDDADTLTLFDTDGETILAIYDCEDAAGDPAHRNIKRFRRRLS